MGINSCEVTSTNLIFLQLFPISINTAFPLKNQTHTTLEKWEHAATGRVYTEGWNRMDRQHDTAMNLQVIHFERWDICSLLPLKLRGHLQVNQYLNRQFRSVLTLKTYSDTPQLLTKLWYDRDMMSPLVSWHTIESTIATWQIKCLHLQCSRQAFQLPLLT